MPNNDTDTALASELSGAIDELQGALQRASDAATRIRSLVPRVSAVNALLDEIESVIQARRLGGAPDTQTPAYARPTLIVTEAEPPAPQAAAPGPDAGPELTPEPRSLAQTGKPAQELICFRLEFQSTSGPLDLRAVDDAVSEHPAVRDVALLDYDGRRATLKVWIVAEASPSDVQEALTARASDLFADAGNVTIIALEDAA